MNRVLDSLRRFQFAQTAAFHRASEALGVPDAALHAMRTVVSDTGPDGVAMKDLAHDLGVSPAVVTGIVDRLEEKGWIRRELHRTDRRSTIVVPTVDDDSDVMLILHALDAPLRRVANSVSDDVAAVVRTMAGAMETELRQFDPDAAIGDGERRRRA